MLTFRSGRRACSELAVLEGRDPTSCKYTNDRTDFLASGRSTVVVDSVSVDRKPVPIESNSICSYEGTIEPVADGRPKQLYYGRPGDEDSNAKRAYYPAAARVSETDGFDLSRGYGLLNCSLNLSSAGNVATAEIRYDALGIHYPDVSNPLAGETFEASAREAKIKEDANSCYLISGAPGLEKFVPCFEFDSGATLDSVTSPQNIVETVEFSDFSSFGWDNAPVP